MLYLCPPVSQTSWEEGEVEVGRGMFKRNGRKEGRREGVKREVEERQARRERERKE